MKYAEFLREYMCTKNLTQIIKTVFLKINEYTSKTYETQGIYTFTLLYTRTREDERAKLTIH